ncbi:hypothetical protein [Chryseobacterium sp. ON_d1]|uniref:hypothetical protein n=1 Tax=Chryseobacterium sp. ON_d1 TaxID=2583211 RepID=UPI0011586DD6|nr:hypothetical protein [Chryseobacterium sp. ON_d1]
MLASLTVTTPFLNKQKLIHHYYFKDYKKILLSFTIFRIGISHYLYLFIFYFASFYANSQIFQKENGSLHVTKGTIFISKKNIADSSSAVNIYIAEGTTVTGLQEFTKSKISINYLKNKFPKKHLKSIKLKKSNAPLVAKNKEINSKSSFKNCTKGRMFLMVSKSFFSAVILDVTNYQKISGLLRKITLHFSGNSKKKLFLKNVIEPKSYLEISGFYSVRPPPAFILYTTVL